MKKAITDIPTVKLHAPGTVVRVSDECISDECISHECISHECISYECISHECIISDECIKSKQGVGCLSVINTKSAGDSNGLK